MMLCAICAKPFHPRTSLHSICSVRCALSIPTQESKRQKAEKRADKARLGELSEMLPTLRSKAQVAFNAWIRARDESEPCICCGKWPQGEEALRGGAWDAGHFRSRGACPELAFDEDNCHKQLKRCNGQSWDVAGYRANLLVKIGPDRLAVLEGPHSPKHYSKDDYKRIAAEYRAKTRQLQRCDYR